MNEGEKKPLREGLLEATVAVAYLQEAGRYFGKMEPSQTQVTWPVLVYVPVMVMVEPAMLLSP